MLLGDIIQHFEDEAVAMEALVSLGDLPLLARVEEAATAQGVAPGEFAASAVAIFSQTASDEDWVSLIGVMGRTQDPGEACLRAMISFALRPQGASHGCGHAHHHG